MTASANGTTIVQGIVDAGGTVWTINDAGQVALNGVGDKTTANVITLVYANGLLWQQSTTLMWWHKTTNPTGANWLPAGGSATGPIIATPPGAPTGVTAL